MAATSSPKRSSRSSSICSRCSGRHPLPREDLGRSLVRPHAHHVGLDIETVEQAAQEEAVEPQPGQMHAAGRRDPELAGGARHEEIAGLERLGVGHHGLARGAQLEQRAAQRLAPTPAAEAAVELHQHAPHVRVGACRRQRLQHLQQPEARTAGAQATRAAYLPEPGTQPELQPVAAPPRQREQRSARRPARCRLPARLRSTPVAAILLAINGCASCAGPGSRPSGRSRAARGEVKKARPRLIWVMRSTKPTSSGADRRA